MTPIKYEVMCFELPILTTNNWEEAKADFMEREMNEGIGLYVSEDFKVREYIITAKQLGIYESKMDYNKKTIVGFYGSYVDMTDRKILSSYVDGVKTYSAVKVVNGKFNHNATITLDHSDTVQL